ncbi:hypothetical protein BKA67DRAFT_660521 [Truncatella angustata]|uniref:Uncharacterized protein n=1 Tax=Truncatella angustata TaxID=152316 RepID=A0A9P8UGL5_9PEZI|nr:uncharacterized protein BKA67DRAFT_660521 [Truncatella angustata]KAH6651733.1 hypothetical protein BKA67DRAFT_660521 [Truncatella angustata]
MSLKVPTTRQRKSRSSGQEVHKILVEPTPEKQVIYDQVRDEEARYEKQRDLEQHVTSQSYPCPANLRAPPMVRSVTNESHISDSMSPVSTTDIADQAIPTIEVSHTAGKRLRGRRHGPLPVGKRFKTAIKRKLNLVCKHCKEKKVVCDHYDLSKFEEAYQFRKRPTQTESARLSPIPTDLLGFGDDDPLAPDLPPDEDLGSDLSSVASRPNSRQQDLHNFINNFDSRSVSLGTGTLQTSFGRSYNPGLPSPAPPFQNLSPPFPIGSEMPAYPGRWRCEYRRLSSNSLLEEDCSWSGPVGALKQHFALEHYSFEEEEWWLCCLSCESLSLGSNHPVQCLMQNCYGTSWKRWLYGHTLIETPALTQSGESESGFSFDASGYDDRINIQYGAL